MASCEYVPSGGTDQPISSAIIKLTHYRGRTAVASMLQVQQVVDRIAMMKIVANDVFK
jgi:hypothetical protein